MKPTKPRCECPSDSMNNPMPASMYSEEEQSGIRHLKGECPCVAGLKKYKRGDKILHLCSCCNQAGDKEEA